MLIKSEKNCDAFVANDGCTIVELLHPKNDAVDLPYSFAIAIVEAGQASYRHRLRQTEIYYLLSGAGLMHVDDEVELVQEGDAVVIPAGAVQWIENRGETRLKFAAVVSPPWREEDDLRLE